MAVRFNLIKSLIDDKWPEQIREDIRTTHEGHNRNSLIYLPDPVNHSKLRFGHVGRMYEFSSAIKIGPNRDTAPEINPLLLRQRL